MRAAALVALVAGGCGAARRPAPLEAPAAPACVRAPPEWKPGVAMIFGVVTDTRGVAIAGAKVEVVAWDGGPLHRWPVRYQTVTRGDGQYTLHLSPGTYLVRFATATHSVVWIRELMLPTLDRFDAQIELSRAPGVVALFDGMERKKWINPAIPWCWACPALEAPAPEWWLDAPCPQGATLKLRVTDEEQSASCELPDGTRHGPYTRWSSWRVTRPSHPDALQGWEESGWYVHGKRCGDHGSSAN